MIIYDCCGYNSNGSFMGVTVYGAPLPRLLSLCREAKTNS